MVTGDDVTTGAAIAKQLGIPGEAMLGTDFAALSEPERLRRIDDIGVVGRVAPEHKVLLVETLRKKGHVVAMTGDGVNDAPAIKAADIGIAMGSGTEVAKNAGRMILSDDNFATIVKAVEKGRAVYDNLNKFIRFVMLELVAYIITFLGASILNIAAGQPFSASQILYINFLVNAPLGIALGMDKETPGLMDRAPRPRDATIMTRGLLTTAGLVGLFMAVCTLALISYGTTHYDSVAIGSSMGLTAFSLLIVASAFQARSVTATALTGETFDNRHLNWTALAEIVLAVLITQMDVMRRIFGTEQLTGEQWLLALVPAIALFFLWELGKLVARRGAEPEAGRPSRRGAGRLATGRPRAEHQAAAPEPRLALAITPGRGPGRVRGRIRGRRSDPGCFFGMRPVKNRAMTPITARIESDVRRPSICDASFWSMISFWTSAGTPASVRPASTSALETNGAPAASSVFAWSLTDCGTFGLDSIPARNEAVSAAIRIEPASAVPSEAPSWVAVFCRPPTSELCSVGTADTVTLPSCDASAPMPSPMMTIGTNTIEESAPTSRLPISTTSPATSASRPTRTTRRGLACGRNLGTPTAATSSASESGTSRMPVSMGESPSTTERNSGTVKNTPAWIRNRNRKVMSPPVSCR